MNPKGDITISTLIKLLLGILIVAILVFLVYRYIIRSPVGENECKAMLIEWCMTCDLLDYLGGPPMNEELKVCALKYGYMAPKNSCGDAGVGVLCNNFLPEIS